MSTAAGIRATDEKAIADFKGPAFALGALERMMRIRAFEQKCLDLSIASPPQIIGSVHLCAGQEAVPVGALAALRPDDRVVATYRGHGWALECGISTEALFAEVCHRAIGVNGGRAGSAMAMSMRHRFIGENSIVGAGGPIACGSALASLTEADGTVTIVSFGDGATSQGALHESLVFAATRKLPVIFVCENNGWSELTKTADLLQVNRLARRAAGYGMRGVTIDGSDPIAVAETIRVAADSARSGEGPVFVECEVPRLWGHYNRDQEHYRSKADKAAAEAHDPLTRLSAKLVESGVATAAEIEAMRDRVSAELDQVAKSVLASAEPDPATATHHIYAAPMPIASASTIAADVQEITYIKAVNEALRAELTANPKTLVYGEDVGASGGIFAAARYLQRDFGEDRVFDTPIAEAAILGSAVGAAMCGMRPIVEIMWGDFLLVALDQLVNQAANIRYVSQGETSAPMVVRLQQGATPGSCPQHSQCLEALLAHIPGLRVGLPATPQDAYDMLRAAANDPDPCIIIEARALYQTKGPMRFRSDSGPIGGARQLREGRDGGLICWGTSVAPTLEAAESLSSSGLDVGVLDLRWLNPLDEGAIARFVEDSGGRVIVVHEANQSGGFGAEIAARIAESGAPLRMPVRRLGAANSRIPASPVLQGVVLPTAQRIVEAARGWLG